jgi:hypothetical protein
MPITVIVETGEGLADANSYASVAEADSFHETNVHSAAKWAVMTSDQKAMSLITATRILDQQWQWNGYKKSVTQALQWPRVQVPDPDAAGTIVPPSYGYPVYLLDNEVPAPIKRATMDFAHSLFNKNPEVSASGEGLESFSLDGVMSASFNYDTRPDIVPEWIQTELSKYGRLVGAKSGVVKLIRA